MSRAFIFLSLLLSLICPLQIGGATGSTTHKLANNGRQVAEGEHFPKHLKKQKRGSRGKFVRDGGIGKLSIWALTLAFLLAFFGQLLFAGAWLAPVAWSLVGLAFLLAVIGVFLGGENGAISKAVLKLFAVVGIIGGVIYGFIWLAFKKGWIGD